MNNSNRLVLFYAIILVVLSVAVLAFVDAPHQTDSHILAKPLLQSTATNTPRSLPPTATATNTSLASATPTLTQTPTMTRTPTPTFTRTPTNTPTQTPIIIIVPTSTTAPTSTSIPVPEVLATVTPLLSGPVAVVTPLILTTATPTPAASALPTTGNDSAVAWFAAGLVAIALVFGARYLRQSST